MRTSVSRLYHVGQCAVGFDQFRHLWIGVIDEAVNTLLGVFSHTWQLLVDDGHKRGKRRLLSDDQSVQAAKHRDDLTAHNLILPMVAHAAYRACGVAVSPCEKDVA